MVDTAEVARQSQSGAVPRRVVRRATRGDADALEVVWRHLHPIMLRFVASLGVRDPEDIASQVWLEVARGLPSFDGDGDDLKRLVLTIARRRVIDARRSESRRDVHFAAYAPVVVDHGDPVDEVVALANAQALLRALPAAQAEVIALRVIGGFSAKETAQITGQSEGAVRVMMARALRKLRELLAQNADAQRAG